MTDVHLPTFKTKRLTLRHLREDDFDFMRELDTNLEVTKFFTNPHRSEEDTLKAMQKAFANYEVFEIGMYLVEDSLTGEKLGRAGLFPKKNEEELIWELGYSFKPSAWGKGFATEVATFLMNWGLENLNTDFIVAVIHADHLDSIHVANKIGMNHWKDDEINGAHFLVYRTL